MTAVISGIIGTRRATATDRTSPIAVATISAAVATRRPDVRYARKKTPSGPYSTVGCNQPGDCCFIPLPDHLAEPLFLSHDRAKASAGRRLGTPSVSPDNFDHTGGRVLCLGPILHVQRVNATIAYL